MSIAIYFNPPSGLTKRQYEETVAKLSADGEWPPKGLQHHSCFGEEGHLMVYEVWDSQASLDAFGARLMPVLGAAGIDPGQPDVMPVVNLLP